MSIWCKPKYLSNGSSAAKLRTGESSTTKTLTSEWSGQWWAPLKVDEEIVSSRAKVRGTCVLTVVTKLLKDQATMYGKKAINPRLYIKGRING